MEINGASGPLPSATLGRKTHRVTRKIQLSKAQLAAAQQALKSSSCKGASKVRGASAPSATTEVGSTLAGPRVEEEAAQSLGQLCGEVASPRAGSGTPPAAPLRLRFPLRHSSG